MAIVPVSNPLAPDVAPEIDKETERLTTYWLLEFESTISLAVTVTGADVPVVET